MVFERDTSAVSTRAPTGGGNLAWRSDGPLDAEQRAACRSEGVALAYDPVQIGWVRRDCADDVDGRLEVASVALKEAMRARFERLAGPTLSDWVGGRIERDEIEALIWSFSERVVTEYRTHSAASDELRSEALRELQQLASDRIARRVRTAAEREQLTAQCQRLAETYRLRPWRVEDAERYLALLDDPRVWKYLPEAHPREFSRETALSLIELSNTATHHEVRAIEVDGEVVGQVRLEFERRNRQEVDVPREAEISYWVGVDHWGRGIMGDVVQLYTRNCFIAHDLDSVFARIREENTASIRLAVNSGYHFEGRLRSELDREPGMCTYRVFRGHFMTPRPTESGGKARAAAASAAASTGAPERT